MSANRQPPSRVLHALLGTTLCLGLILPAAAVHAAGLSTTLTDTATGACRRAAEAAGYSVDQVISAKQSFGDRSTVVLQLSKGEERFEFSCGYSEALRKLPAIAAAPAIRRDAPVAATPSREASGAGASRIASQPTAREEHELRAAAREQARSDRRAERPAERPGIPLMAWLLPLLLLPLFAMLMRRPEDQESAPVAPASSGVRTIDAPVTVISNRDLVVIRNGGAVIPVYAAPTDSATASGSLADGQSVTLSGRREAGWAELERGGWIETRHISAEVAKV